MFEQECKIEVDDISLTGDLTIPEKASGIVVFAHGSGSSRHSPRNRSVAQFLNQQGLATLLIDLLTAEEESVDELTRELRFDISLLADRLVKISDWLSLNSLTQALKQAYFGASTGAAAAIVAAAERPDKIVAVVSRGGRADLAGAALAQLKAPVLLIVGGADVEVIDLNKEAQKQLNVMNQLKIVPNATHLFEEMGALEQVATLANEWFKRYLV